MADNLAELFLTKEQKKYLKDRLSRERLIAKLLGPQLYGFIIARTAFIDNIFEQAVRDNIPQIVFFGAGYDTRPYRFSGLIKQTKIYELDVPATQKSKKDILEKSKVMIPPQLSYVEINFESDKLEEILFRRGYDKNKKTLFIWEGVIYYLNKTAVERTLEFVKSNSAAGSAIVFDYMKEKMISMVSSEPV